MGVELIGVSRRNLRQELDRQILRLVQISGPCELRVSVVNEDGRGLDPWGGHMATLMVECLENAEPHRLSWQGISYSPADSDMDGGVSRPFWLPASYWELHPQAAPEEARDFGMAYAARVFGHGAALGRLMGYEEMGYRAEKLSGNAAKELADQLRADARRWAESGMHLVTGRCGGMYVWDAEDADWRPDEPMRLYPQIAIACGTFRNSAGTQASQPSYLQDCIRDVVAQPLRPGGGDCYILGDFLEFSRALEAGEHNPGLLLMQTALGVGLDMDPHADRDDSAAQRERPRVG